MKTWLRSFGGAVGMGVLWAVGWGLGVGGFIEAFVDPHGEIVDIWPTVLAIPGFVAGMTFWALVRIAEGGPRFDAASLPRVVAFGAATGLLVGALAARFWVPGGPATLIVPSTVLLGAISAWGSPALIRTARTLRARRA